MTDKLYIFFDTETTGVPRDYKATQKYFWELRCRRLI